MTTNINQIDIGDRKFVAQIRKNWSNPETIIKISTNVLAELMDKLVKCGQFSPAEVEQFHLDVRDAVAASTTPEMFSLRFTEIALQIVMGKNICEVVH
jgi:hypothetical protein